MPGRRITEQQVRLYMSERKKTTQRIAAAKAGISERSARRIDNNQLQPNSSKVRTWRTREDPLASVWDSVVVPMLESGEGLTPVGIFDYLCDHHADVFNTSSRRTLERRIANWRHQHGKPKEVMFLQRHEFGKLGIADFTHIQSKVTISGTPLPHLLFHYRLPASKRAYAQVIYGGESFAALSDGLQNAFVHSGGVPKELRTDSLSAAYNNRSNLELFTNNFNELSKHYGFKPTRNNSGVAHENGAIEASHRHLKNQVDQALKLRGSCDFKTKEDYELFIRNLVDRRNKRIEDRYRLEQRQLQALPVNACVNYKEIYVTVARTSTISLSRVTYSVPSRLIGAKLLAKAYDSYIELYLGVQKVLTLDRIYSANKNSRTRSINYKHVIESLVKKPRAFRYSQIRDDLLPSDNYKQIWSYLDANLAADEACYYIVKLLYIAYKSGYERQLGQYVIDAINLGNLPSIYECEARYTEQQIPTHVTIDVMQHSLQSYNFLLEQAHG